MAKITLDMADELVDDLGKGADEVGREIMLAAAFFWCRRGDLSTSKAARFAGVTYAEFLHLAVQRQAVLYDYDPEELDAEMRRQMSDISERHGTMSANDLREWLRAAPFEPFRIEDSLGGRYEIRSPDDAELRLGVISLSRQGQWVATIALRYLVGIEPLVASVTVPTA